MLLTEILSSDRIAVDSSGAEVPDRSAALRTLARLLAGGAGAPEAELYRRLEEREQLQSTGIGDGVAIPHTSLDDAPGQRAALVLVRRGVDFQAIDQAPVYIIFGVVGPKRAASEHLKILARVSRLLRSPETRRRLLESATPEAAYSLIEEHESSAMSA